MEINDFLKHVKSKNFFVIKKRILVAVSGGIDSMVLLHLMQQTDYQLAVAHIDHKTRNGQSTQDALFVEKYCNNHNIPFYKSEYTADTNNGNFHQKAHEFRYHFFESLNHGYILTAHHRDDHVETIALNFINGKSLKGIPEVNGNIIRPLLPYPKSAIVSYAQVNAVPYVEDSSNNTDTYDRNFIRNKVMPLLNSHFDNIEEKLINHSMRRHEDDRLLERLVGDKIQLTHAEQMLSIPKEIIGKDAQLLYHSIKKFGFNRHQAADMIGALDHIGSIFHTEDYTILIDHNSLIINEKSEKITDVSYLALDEIPATVKFLDYELSFEKVSVVTEVSAYISYFPMRLLDDTLLIRTWRDGDDFLPNGMNGKRKTLKKFFADSKIDRFRKHQIPLLISAGNIMWICGYRSDHRFRYDTSDSELLKVTLSS